MLQYQILNFSKFSQNWFQFFQQINYEQLFYDALETKIAESLEYKMRMREERRKNEGTRKKQEKNEQKNKKKAQWYKVKRNKKGSISRTCSRTGTTESSCERK